MRRVDCADVRSSPSIHMVILLYRANNMLEVSNLFLGFQVKKT